MTVQCPECGVLFVPNEQGGPREQLRCSYACRVKSARRTHASRLGTDHAKGHKSRRLDNFEHEVAEVKLQLYGPQDGKPSVEQQRERMLAQLHRELHELDEVCQETPPDNDQLWRGRGGWFA